MINDLSTTLKAILSDTSLPSLIHEADVAFERPADSFSPNKKTINLFLYDIRENSDLRSNEPLVQSQNGVATISRPPLRVACAYQVTAWIDSSVSGEQAILDQHQLLGEVLRVFSRMPTVDEKFLQGDLKLSLYPVSLATAQADLVRNPAEFWTAMGSKLRPSFTVTATAAMDRAAPPVVEKLTSSAKFTVTDTTTGVAENSFRIGGTVRDATSHAALASVKLSLVELNVLVTSDPGGHFCFSFLAEGRYTLRAVRTGYRAKSLVIQIPRDSSTSLDIELRP